MFLTLNQQLLPFAWKEDQQHEDPNDSVPIRTLNYQVSCPHRMKAYEQALDYITSHDDVWVTTGREIADYFIDQQDKILYLDADIACQGNLKPLITMDLANNVAAVVTERDANWWSLRGQSLQCNELEKGYFNSGVLLINTLAWAQESVSAKAMSMLADKAIVSRLTYMDQDILNLILLGKVKFIDAKYNTQFSLNYELKKSFVCPINDETVLIHYVGPTKPWHYWAGYPSAQPFIKAKEASPWKNEPLMRPVNSNYARYCAKHNFKQNKPINGIMNYIYYFYLKIIK